MKQKRILQLLYSDDVSIGNIRKEVSRSFSACESKITIVFLIGSQKTKPADNEQYIFLGFSKKGIKFQNPVVYFKLWSFLKQGNFDVIFCHRSKTLSLIQKINKLLKIKQCIFISHNFSEFKKPLRRLSLSLFSDHSWQYIGISEAISEHLRTLNNGTISKQVSTINNAIDYQETTHQLFPKQLALRKLNLPENKFIFGTVGRITRSKGQYDLIRAFHILYQSYPDSCLVLVGPGSDSGLINSYIETHGLSSSVFLLGFLENASRYMSAFDTFILPSHKEGFGLVLIEAMAAKLPIIATNTGGIPNVLGSEGTLVPVSDIDALASVMKSYREFTAEELSQMAKRLQQRASTHFDINIFQERYRSLICSKI